MPALAHEYSNNKTWQLAASYGLMNLMRRVGKYWLPRNTNTSSAGEPLGNAGRELVQALQSGKAGDSSGFYTPKVINNYVRQGIHMEAA